MRVANANVIFNASCDLFNVCVCVMTTCSGYRYATEGTVDPIAVTAGIVQTGLYIDFFYVYFTK